MNVTGVPTATILYTYFTGNGNWNISANWLKGMMPPANLTDNRQIWRVRIECRATNNHRFHVESETWKKIQDQWQFEYG